MFQLRCQRFGNVYLYRYNIKWNGWKWKDADRSQRTTYNNCIFELNENKIERRKLLTVESYVYKALRLEQLINLSK